MISLIKKYTIKYLSDIIGQDNNTSFLQNSIFKNLLYPLYLFSGMRGTGKTTSARLFAASLLCEKQEQFRKNPQTNIPCYECHSCILYKKNQHPDIIELDAASHTGIDTIRSIIDNAFLLPVICSKKIYIIDEVHMLSKAAFNACLKIMEEPPENVHFILATTEIHKVLDTIKSRSIILHYKPIKEEVLRTYLCKICKAEGITIEESALNIIINIGEGSVRDTVNIINRLLLINLHITEFMVLEEYGLCDRKAISEFIQTIINQNEEEYYEKKKYISITEQNKIIFFEETSSCLQNYLEKSIREKNTQNISQGYYILEYLYQYEDIFFNSIDPLGIFDLLFLSQNKFQKKKFEIYQKELTVKPDNISLNNDFVTEHTLKNIDENLKEEEIGTNETILTFINHLEKIIKTIFLQGKITVDKKKKTITIIFQKNFYFYKDFLRSKEDNILEAAKLVWEEDFSLEYRFDQVNNELQKKKSIELLSPAYNDKVTSKEPYSSNKRAVTNNTIDILPRSKLVKSVADLFPGETTLLSKKENHE